MYIKIAIEAYDSAAIKLEYALDAQKAACNGVVPC